MEQLIGLGSRRVALEIEGPRAARVARFVCGGLSRDDGDPATTLFVPEEPSAARPVVQADILSADMVESLVREVADGPTFHAAATLYNGKAIIMPGICGAGKSTLTTWLCHVRGHQYLTDEAILIRSDDLQLEYVQRPVHLKAGSNAFAREHQLLDMDDDHAWYLDEHSWLAPSYLNKGAAIPQQVPIGAIVLPTYNAAVDLEIEPIASGRAAGQLLQVYLNSDLLGKEGFLTVASALDGVPAFRLVYGDTARLPEAWDAIEAGL